MTSLLKTTSRYIGIMDMIMATLIGIGFMIRGTFIINMWMGDPDPDDVFGVLAIFMLFIIICICLFYLGLMLKIGSEDEDLKKCIEWLHVRRDFFIINLLEVVIIVSFLGAKKVSLGEILGAPLVYVQLIGLLGQIFCILVVSKFIEELKAGGNLGKKGNNKQQQVFTIA